MRLGRYVVDAVVLEGRSPSELAKAHKISRRWILLANVRLTRECPAKHVRSWRVWATSSCRRRRTIASAACSRLNGIVIEQDPLRGGVGRMRPSVAAGSESRWRQRPTSLESMSKPT